MGEGAIALSYQEALARKFSPETAAVLENSPLSYEWAFTIAELDRRIKARECRVNVFQRYPDIISYAQIMSQRMRLVDDIDSTDVDMAPPRQLKEMYKLAWQAYFAHNGLHDMSLRTERLEKIARIMSAYIDQQEQAEVPGKLHSGRGKEAILGSVYEELGMLFGSHEPKGEFYRRQALEIYAGIVIDESIPAYSGHKFDAEFSLMTLLHRDIMASFEAKDSYMPRYLQKQKKLFGLRRQFYQLMQEKGQMMLDFLNNESDIELARRRTVMLSGTIMEFIVLGDVIDELVMSGPDTNPAAATISARRAYKREDHNERISIRRHASPLAVPNFSFDLVLEDSRNNGPLSKLSVEIKKGKNYSTGRFVNKYLPTTYLIGVEAPKLPEEFAEFVIDYAAAKLRQFADELLTEADKRLLAKVRDAVKPRELINLAET